MRALLVALLLLPACAASGGPLPLGAGRAHCGTCHETQAEAFSRSAHARSDASPVLAALLPHARDAWGAAAADRCQRCHAPAHAALGGAEDGSIDVEASVTCITCHAAVGNRGERDGLLLVDPAAPMGGPFADAEPTPAHASRAAPLVSSPSLCGTCHEVTGPSVFVEETLSEHRVASPDAGDPSCASCHLPRRADGPIALGSDRARARVDHAFVGLDPAWGGTADEQSAATRDAVALLASALSVEVHRDGDAVEVRVTNVGAGHAVPTGVAFLRDVWVDVELDGRVVAPHLLSFGDQPLRDGQPVALITDADTVERHRLDAGESRAASLAVPAGSVEVVLRARAIREEVLLALALEARAAEVPTLEVVRVVP